MDLLSPMAEVALARVLTIGAKKYAANNWRQGIAWSRVYAALRRHLLKWAVGEKFDSEDGQHHLDSVLCCAMFLREYEETHPELNDLYQTPELRDATLRYFEQSVAPLGGDESLERGTGQPASQGYATSGGVCHGGTALSYQTIDPTYPAERDPQDGHKPAVEPVDLQPPKPGQIYRVTREALDSLSHTHQAEAIHKSSEHN